MSGAVCVLLSLDIKQLLVVFACSLENIYKELSTDIEDFTHPGHGDLTGWAKQGELTCSINEPAVCHKKAL